MWRWNQVALEGEGVAAFRAMVVRIRHPTQRIRFHLGAERLHAAGLVQRTDQTDDHGPSCTVARVMPKAVHRSTRRRCLTALISVALLSLLLPAGAVPVAAQAATSEGWQARRVGVADVAARDQQLAGQLPRSAKLGYHPETGRVRFISGTPSTPLSGSLPGVAAGARRLTAADARAKASRFIERYGSLFGLRHPDRELRIRETERHLAPALGVAITAAAGLPNATVRFGQVRSGVEVMGGELVVQLTADGEVLSVAGEVLPSGAKVTTRPRVAAGQAGNVAARWVARETGRLDSSVVTVSEGLGLYDSRLMDDPTLADAGSHLVWRIDASLPATTRHQSDRRLVLVDALSGQVLASIGRTVTAEGPSRRVCDNRNVPGRSWGCNTPYVRVEGQSPSGVADVDAAYRLMGVTYDYFADRFGRDGVDDKGSRMKATVRYCPSLGCPWRNAEWRWGLQQATFGRGWAMADDIVGHEYTHGLLDVEAPLFYHYQSGAINESYADVFGELIDLSYPGGKDSSWAKWKIGEDTPIGVFRDMRDPARYGHPDRVRSPRWHAGTSDYGGVHRNNGVGNKAAYLVAAGGNFRGYQIKGIGQDRTARVWYQALTTRLTSAANYVDLADALVSACTDLVGSRGMTLAHCKSVRDATFATQMNVTPLRLRPATAPICGPGRSPFYVLRDDLEDPASGSWVGTRTVGPAKGWYWPQNPNGISGWDGTWASSGKVNFFAPDRGTRSDATMRMAMPVRLPPRAVLRFGHGYSFDKDAKRRYDGAVVEIKVDGAPWRGVGGLFTHGKYNGTMAKGYGNPLAGKRAWTGDSHGWSKARLDLSRFAGSNVKVRFRMVSDRQIGGGGWYIDDVSIYSCADDSDKPTGTLLINEGQPTTGDANVSLDLSWADASTWVSSVRLSGSPKLNAGGQLLKGITMPVRASVAWDLADTSFGGSGGSGLRTVYAQVRDVAGNWSNVLSDEIELLAR